MPDGAVAGPEGRSIVVVGGGVGVGRRLARALAAPERRGAGSAPERRGAGSAPERRGAGSVGWVVVVAGDAGTEAAVAAEVEAAGGRAAGLTVDVADRADADRALARAAELAPLAAVVLAHVPAAALVPGPVAELDVAGWDATAEAPVRAALTWCQAAHAALDGSSDGGRIVLVVPTLALTGAAGLVPLAVAAESQRLLAKSAARAWGPDGITVNALAVPAGALGDGLPEGLGTVPGAGNPALPDRAGGDAVDLGPIVDFLAGPGSAALTGATLCLDGGVVMAP